SEQLVFLARISPRHKLQDVFLPQENLVYFLFISANPIRVGAPRLVANLTHSGLLDHFMIFAKKFFGMHKGGLGRSRTRQHSRDLLNSVSPPDLPRFGEGPPVSLGFDDPDMIIGSNRNAGKVGYRYELPPRRSPRHIFTK